MKQELGILSDVYQWAYQNKYNDLTIIPNTVIPSRDSFSVGVKIDNKRGTLIFKYTQYNVLSLQNIIGI